MDLHNEPVGRRSRDPHLDEADIEGSTLHKRTIVSSQWERG
jgi:hypothetical protein